MDVDAFRRGWSTPLVTVPRSLSLPEWLDDRGVDFLRFVGLPRFMTWKTGTHPKIDLSFDRLDHRVARVRDEVNDVFDASPDVVDALIIGDWSFDGGAHVWWCVEARTQRIVGVNPEREESATSLVASSLDRLAELLLAFRDWGRANAGRVGEWTRLEDRLLTIDSLLDENSAWLAYIRYEASRSARVNWPIDDLAQ